MDASWIPSACVRALAGCVSWERGRAGGGVASVRQRGQRERLSGFSPLVVSHDPPGG